MSFSLFASRALFQRHYAQCGECGETCEDGLVGDHMVNVHGYIRVGAQVFKRVLCKYKDCGQPGLYKVGVYVSCQLHREELKRIAVQRTRSYDEGVSARIEGREDTIERQHKVRDSKDRMKRSFHPLQRSA